MMVSQDRPNRKAMKRKTLLTTAVILVLVVSMTMMPGCLFLFKRGNISDFAEEFFESAFISDAMSANFFIENPEETLGFVPEPSIYEPPESEKQHRTNCKAYKRQAGIMPMQFKRSKMSGQDADLYDFLHRWFLLQSEYEDYYYFRDDFIGGYSGAQANLPLYLIEYKFRREQDVKDYIELCKLTESTFPKWVDYERARLENGYGRPRFVLFYALEQTADFTGAPIIKRDLPDGATIDDYLDCPDPDPKDKSLVKEDCFVLTDALKKLEDSSLTKEQKNSYKAGLREAVNDFLIPSYVRLGNDIKGLLRNKTYSFKGAGLAAYKGGKDYYRVLLKDLTASDDSPDTVYNACLKAFGETKAELDGLRTKLSELGVTDPDRELVDMFNADDWSVTALNETITTLRGLIAGNFPDMPAGGEVRLKTVDESLTDYFAPAAYFVSALDNPSADEVIVINNWKGTGYLSYDLLSHEGIPGHLYQFSHLKNSGISRLIQLLCPMAYKEAWATYCEHYAAERYGEPGSRENLLMKYQLKKTLAKGYIRTMADICVNYEGYGSAATEENPDNSFTVEHWLKQDIGLEDGTWLLSDMTSSEDGKTMEFRETSVKDFASNLAANSVLFPCNAAVYYYGYLQLNQVISALRAKGMTDLEVHGTILDNPYSFAQLKAKFGV